VQVGCAVLDGEAQELGDVDDLRSGAQPQERRRVQKAILLAS
jgi:hypothetical protein